MLLLAGALLGTAACESVSTANPAAIAIAGERVFPESITADSLGTLYIGSNPGTIYRARSGDATATPWIVPNSQNGLQAVFGVFADEARQMLWACSNPAQGTSGPATLKAFDLASGALRASHAFPGTGPALCNDIAIGRDGRVWATDTIGGRIVTLPAGASTLEEWAVSADLRGIDGIAEGADGTLYINNVQRNLLQRVERGPDGAFTGVRNLATSLPLSGPDGLRAIAGDRFIQAEGTGGRVALLTIEGDRAELMPIATGLDYPASVALVGTTAYIPEGKIDYLLDFAKRGQDPGRFTIHAVPLP